MYKWGSHCISSRTLSRPELSLYPPYVHRSEFFFYPTSLGRDRGDFEIQDLNCPNRQNACISKPTSSLCIFNPPPTKFILVCNDMHSPHVFCTGFPCTALLSLHCVGRKNPRPSNPTSGRAINRYPAKWRICTFGTRRLVRSGVVIVVYL